MGFTIKDTILENGECTFEIKKVSTEHCSPRKQTVDCVRPGYSLHFVLFGRGTLITEYGKKYVLNRGYSFLLYKNEKYSYQPDPKDPWSYTWVEFDGDNLDQLLSLCGFSRENCCQQITNFDDYVALMKDLQNAFDARQTQQLRCSAYFVLLLSKFLDGRFVGQEVKSHKTRLMRDILIYINNNCLSEQLSTRVIALENGISVPTLMRLFKEHMGMSPVYYINAYKVAIACEKMLSTDMNASEAAMWSGFDDEKYFSRIFKRIKGMTPTEYRKSKPNEDPFLWIKEKGLLFR